MKIFKLTIGFAATALFVLAASTGCGPATTTTATKKCADYSPTDCVKYSKDCHLSDDKKTCLDGATVAPPITAACSTLSGNDCLGTGRRCFVNPLTTKCEDRPLPLKCADFDNPTACSDNSADPKCAWVGTFRREEKCVAMVTQCSEYTEEFCNDNPQQIAGGCTFSGGTCGPTVADKRTCQFVETACTDIYNGAFTGPDREADCRAVVVDTGSTSVRVCDWIAGSGFRAGKCSVGEVSGKVCAAFKSEATCPTNCKWGG